MNPKKSANSTPVLEDKKALQRIKEITEKMNYAKKIEFACTLEEMARVIRQNVLCMADEFVNDQTTPICWTKFFPKKCWQCLHGKN